jgi:hypothetical protein
MSIHPFLIAVAGIALIGTPALAADRSSDSKDSAALSNMKGQAALLAGDDATATAFEAKSYAKQPTLSNEFNLATAYQRTGQFALAIPLYQEVVSGGKYTNGLFVYNYRTTFRPGPAGFNYAQEASRRLDTITGGHNGETVQALALR